MQENAKNGVESAEVMCDNSQTDRILLSVIIPVFNCEDYLDDCLRSMTKQGFDGCYHEVIVVNDGSTDASKEIIQRYCSQFDYFQSVNQENQGVSEARNHGIRASRGKYLAFCDADDYVADKIYVPILQLMEQDHLQGFLFGRTGNEEELDQFNNQYTIHSEQDLAMSSWRMVFLRDIIVSNSLFFSKGIHYNEDFLFNYKYTQCINKIIAFSQNRLYFNRNNPISATKAVFVDEKKKARYYNSLKQVCVEIKQFSAERKIQWGYLYDYALSCTMTSIVWYAIRCKLCAKDILDDLAKSDLFLSDIKQKVNEGATTKHRLKSLLEYLCRHRLVFMLACFASRLFSKK